MPTTVLSSAPFRPSFPITGSGMYLYRADNLLLRGLPESGMFLSAYQGQKNLNESLPVSALTGTLAFSPSSLTVTGTGTLFQDQLHFGQIVYVGANRPLVVSVIVSQTEFISGTLPITTQSGIQGYRTRNIFPLGTDRASLLWGDASLTDRGNIIAVGDGSLLMNGDPLPGDTLLAKRRAQIAIYDATTNTYSVVDIGFDDVPTTVNTDVTVLATGGTKSMSPGYYSFRVAYFSDTTDGYGNPTPTLLSGGTIGYQVSATNSLIQIDFTDDIPFRPTKATGYIIYASAFSGSSDQSKVNAIQGGWFELVRVTFEELVSLSDLYAFDYVDTDLSSTLASFDNDNPPDADFVSLFAGYVNLVSTNGKGVDSFGREATTSPGPFVSPMKADNIDAYPASQKVPTDRGEVIIGYLNAAGRMFTMTPNTLDASTPTGLPTAPFTLRPFWQRGFASPYGLACIDSTLYGFTTKGPFRSIATGDSAEASNDFAASVDAQMAAFVPGMVMVAYDPKNSAICYFHSACSKNDAGYWQSEVYVFSLKINDWMPRILLTDDARDMIVTSASAIHNDLVFVAGGRRGGHPDTFDTWIFDSPGADQAWFCVFNLSDSGVENISKVLRKIRVRAKLTGGVVKLYAVYPDTAIDVADLVAGTNADVTFLLDDSATVTTYAQQKLKMKNALMWTVRLSGLSVSDGTLASLDQVHEISVEFDVAGQIR